MGFRVLSYRLLAGCGLVLACSLASAQTDEQRAGARALAEQGGAAFDEGRWQDAVDLFSRAQSLVAAPPHLLYIARAQDKQGRLVQAMEAYIKATHSELASGAPSAFVSAKVDAERELQALMPRIPQVTITVSGAQSEDVVVKVDGETLPSALVGVKRPANPGKHTYSAEGASVEAAPVTLSVNERSEAAVELVLKAKAAQAAVAPQTPSPAQPAAAKPGDAAPHDGGSKSSALNIPAYTALAVGAVGLGVGTFFIIKKSGKASDAQSEADSCEESHSCDQGEVDHIVTLDDEAASAGTLSFISYGVGVVGVGVGVALLLMGKDDAGHGKTAPVSLWASDHQVGVAGRF
jgi:tetratricopeptide (TPR) repeat protein